MFKVKIMKSPEVRLL